MQKRDMPTVELNKFSISNGTLVAEASDFGRMRGSVWLRDMYWDSADIGIAIRSHHTGAVARFVLVHTEIDRDDDVMHWEYELAVEPGNNSKIKKVMVIND